MNIHKKILSFLCLGTLLCTTTGCSFFSSAGHSNTVEDPTHKETSTLGISLKDEDFMDSMENNQYYILHDNVYYPVVSGQMNLDAQESLEIENTVQKDRMLFFKGKAENNIPTLYPGDKLVFYSTDTLLDTITWERYADMGYTIGVQYLTENEGGRYYLQLEDAEDLPALENGDLTGINEAQTDQVLFDKIGTTQITSDFVDYGIIVGLQKNQTYDIDTYEGTIYKKYNAKANYHAFHALEVFASTDYETKQDYIYEIAVPEYFVDGYYQINDVGLFRYVTTDTISDDTDYNCPLLYPSTDDEAYPTTATTASGDAVLEQFDWDSFHPACYSENEALNSFSTDLEGHLGYKDPNEQNTKQTEETKDGTKTIQQTIVKTFSIQFQEGADYQIKVTSPSGEKTGNVVLKWGDGTEEKATYDFTTQEYVLSGEGSTQTAQLSINGFYKGYDITLTNANGTPIETQQETTTEQGGE